MNEARGRGTYGRRRGSRYQPSEDEESASSYLSEGVVDGTLAPHDDTGNDALPLRERGGAARLRRHRSPPPRGRAPCCSRSWSHLGRPTGTMTRGHPSNRSSHLPPAMPPMLQDALTEAHWQRIPADVRNCLGLPLGIDAVQDWVLPNAARKAS